MEKFKKEEFDSIIENCDNIIEKAISEGEKLDNQEGVPAYYSVYKYEDWYVYIANNQCKMITKEPAKFDNEYISDDTNYIQISGFPIEGEKRSICYNSGKKEKLISEEGKSTRVFRKCVLEMEEEEPYIIDIFSKTSEEELKKFLNEILDNERQISSEDIMSTVEEEAKLSDVEVANIETGKVIQEEKEIKELLSMAMASNLHESWKSLRTKEDGKYEPKIEKTTDSKWIEEHAGIDEVDIANCSFSELPEDWKRESLEAARVAIEQVYSPIINDEGIKRTTIEEMSSHVYEKSLEISNDSKSGELNVPYEQLPEEEKTKYRQHILDAMEIVSKYARGEIDLRKLKEEFMPNDDNRDVK